MDYQTYLWAVIVLIGVLGMIAVLAWGVRRFGLVPGVARGVGRPSRRLQIVEVLPVDVKRKLVLVRRDNTEHLILLGLQSDLVVEGQIAETGGRDLKLASAGRAAS